MPNVTQFNDLKFKHSDSKSLIVEMVVETQENIFHVTRAVILWVCGLTVVTSRGYKTAHASKSLHTISEHSQTDPNSRNLNEELCKKKLIQVRGLTSLVPR